MLNRTRIAFCVVALAGVASGLVGCTASKNSTCTQAASMGMTAPANMGFVGEKTLGAGDALGVQIYRNDVYLAYQASLENNGSRLTTVPAAE